MKWKKGVIMTTMASSLVDELLVLVVSIVRGVASGVVLTSIYSYA
jgi:hypothetical protein